MASFQYTFEFVSKFQTFFVRNDSHPCRTYFSVEHFPLKWSRSFFNFMHMIDHTKHNHCDCMGLLSQRYITSLTFVTHFQDCFCPQKIHIVATNLPGEKITYCFLVCLYKPFSTIKYFHCINPQNVRYDTLRSLEQSYNSHL